jgi:uncharacterized protein
MMPGLPDPVERVALFARLLRDAGMRTGPDCLIDAAAALGCVDIVRIDEVRDALGAVFVKRHEEMALFDAAFDLFWSARGVHAAAGAIPQRRRAVPMDPDRARAWTAVLGLPSSTLGAAREGQPVPASSSGYSPVELLRDRDFGDMSWEETLQVRRLLRQSRWRLAQRRTRRLGPARRGRIELRRTLRRMARRGGDVPRLDRTRAQLRRRPLVILCDVSASMDRYSRELLIFAHTLARRERTEAFVFSTRLTRITHLLRRRDVDDALDHVTRQAHDIGGGTRIGSALRDFNRRYARRVLGHGAVVLIISDGWDRGDIDLLEAELARLRRSCHRLVWLNPLLGSDSYQPQTRGMAAALPHCDDFLPAHNVDALDELGAMLAALPQHSAARGGRISGGAAGTRR